MLAYSNADARKLFGVRSDRQLQQVLECQVRLAWVDRHPSLCDRGHLASCASTVQYSTVQYSTVQCSIALSDSVTE